MRRFSQEGRGGDHIQAGRVDCTEGKRWSRILDGRERQYDRQALEMETESGLMQRDLLMRTNAEYSFSPPN